MSDDDMIRRVHVASAIQAHVRDDHDRNDLARAIAALPAVSPKVEVRPLVWERIEKDPAGYVWKAKKPFGSSYYIHRNGAGEYASLNHSEYDTLDAAKAAAQADYEARILATLEPAARDLVPALLARAEAAEAKLAKAVDALEGALLSWDMHDKHGDVMRGDWVYDAKATLAETKGD